jgi:large subunit ribosomal protein L21
MTKKIAIIRTGGKQYRVQEGDTLTIEKLDIDNGGEAKFDTLLVSGDEGKNLEVGTPSLGERTTATVDAQVLGEKKVTVKYKNKTRYSRTKNHRQMGTKVTIKKIA